jgi:hypothetical protein
VSVRPAAAERGGAACVQKLVGGAGNIEQERAGEREVVWELAGSRVSSNACSEGLFIGQGVGDKGGQKVAGAGALATCVGDAGRGGLACVLAGLGRGDGVLWVGAGEVPLVGVVQREERQRGGVRACSSSPPPFLMAWVGAEGAGLDQGSFPGMATGFERRRTVKLIVNLIFLRFLPATNALKKFEFEFLKTATVIYQDIEQGF